MSSTLYQPNIPTGTVRLDTDYKNLRDNFTQINTTYNTDHVPLTDSTNNGYHTTVHLVDQGADPTGVSGTIELYNILGSDGYNNRNQLFIRPGTASSYAMTRNFTPSMSASSGTTFLPGGFVLLWGKKTQTSQGSGSVTFSTAFPNNGFCVWCQPFYTGATPSGGYTVGVKNISATGFDYYANTDSVAYAGFYFYALGN